MNIMLPPTPDAVPIRLTAVPAMNVRLPASPPALDLRFPFTVTPIEPADFSEDDFGDDFFI